MELNSNHRKSLLAELDKAKNDLEIQNKCRENEELKESNSDLIEWFEVSCFLAQQRIKLIEESITTNEIDY